MHRIDTKINSSSEKYQSNFIHQKAITDDLEVVLDKVRKMGSPHHIERHKKRGKLTVRDRIKKLKDTDSFFLEFSPLAAHDLYDDYIPAAGIITGIILIHGRHCVVVANDATVKGGTYYPMTVKKHLRAQEIAMENELPCIYLVDSGGAFLPKQDEVFPDRDHFGRIFYNQARMSAHGIPQISAVMGSCTAGGAYVPAMSDEAIIVNKTGTIFLAGPPLVKAAIGQTATPEELGGARMHTQISGVADHFAEDDDEALIKIRNIISHLPNTMKPEIEFEESEYPAEEIFG
ncbi:MAG: carboxyl transferase domain-containing protein, partial [Candidatus Neomarinimicrobiota bacterium]|nr:carboxyl transferase domain-containing protein [Candidatus Neomarinimicrobiota bacterium]